MIMGQGALFLAIFACKKVTLLTETAASAADLNAKQSINTREKYRKKNEAHTNGFVTLLQSLQTLLLPPCKGCILSVVGQECPQHIPFVKWAGRPLRSE